MSASRSGRSPPGTGPAFGKATGSWPGALPGRSQGLGPGRGAVEVHEDVLVAALEVGPAVEVRRLDAQVQPVQELAGVAGQVAGVVQVPLDGQIQVEPERLLLELPVVVDIPATHQAGPGRAAARGRHVPVAEGGAAVDQPLAELGRYGVQSARMSSRLITTTLGRPDEGGLAVVVGPRRFRCLSAMRPLRCPTQSVAAQQQAGQALPGLLGRWSRPVTRTASGSTGAGRR
jgi:hypothetical protein